MKELFGGKTVLVMGLGRFGGGVDTAKFAYNAGAKVIVTDLASAEQLSESVRQLEECPGIEYHLGSHNTKDFEQSDVIIVNPAIPSSNKFLEIARKNNKFITSQISIFFELCPAKIIGITGSNGKSTTAALTAHILKSRNKRVWLSGNIGNEPLLTVLGEIGADDLVVLELSSFQIEQLAQIKRAPDIALLTNLLPNHLDRYGSFEKYCQAKEDIFKFQKPAQNCPAVSIFNAENELSLQWCEKYKNDKNRTCIKFSAGDVSDDIAGEFTLPGRVNLSNLAAALTIARCFDVNDESIKNHLASFKALPHRLELIADINGVKWYNDSKATTPESTMAALEAFEQPIIIAGGYDKNLPFDELGKKIAQSTRGVILIGQTAEKIKKAIEKNSVTKKNTKIKICDSLEDAVEAANKLAVKNDIVLFSPACASYDMFDNFQQRGKEFIRLVNSGF